MASEIQAESLTDEAVCPICQDFFVDPVILECGHSFCRSCITQSWDKEVRNTCRECGEEFADRSLRVNRALARLSEKVRTLSLNTEEKESKLHCEEHQEELKLFCRDEHKSHSFTLIMEAVKNCKVKSSIQSLTTNKSAIQDMEEQQKEKIAHVREEVGHKRRISDDTQVLSLAERSYHPLWLNAVLGEPSVAINQVSVTLDVETAHPQLKVSLDRKRVRCTATWKIVPDTGKRFKYRACVLGSEGFTSGRHYWEVEVAGSEWWSLGVTAESVERKRRVDLIPETGVWRIRRRDDVFHALTSPRSPLLVRPIPGRVGVYLSYESGTVSFYDADTKSHLHTFTGNKFTEKLYPFFRTWNLNQCLRICSDSAPGV